LSWCPRHCAPLYLPEEALQPTQMPMCAALVSGVHTPGAVSRGVVRGLYNATTRYSWWCRPSKALSHAHDAHTVQMRGCGRAGEWGAMG